MLALNNCNVLFQDNPSDFSYFFDTSRRRCCYIAPERFVESGLKNQEGAGQTIDLTSNDEVKSGDITPPMDIFSAGSVSTKRISPIFICMKIYFHKYEAFFISLEFNLSVCLMCCTYIKVVYLKNLYHVIFFFRRLKYKILNCKLV